MQFNNDGMGSGNCSLYQLLLNDQVIIPQPGQLSNTYISTLDSFSIQSDFIETVFHEGWHLIFSHFKQME